MMFSWKEVVTFFAVLLLIGLLLYPSEYFRGQMHHQEGDRAKSIAFFKYYLARHPYHKGAVRSLVDAYEAAGKPEEAVAVMSTFYRGRPGDLESGLWLLDLLHRADMKDRAAVFRWELFRDIRHDPSVDARVLQELMYEAYQEAVSAQNDEVVVKALMALAELGGAGYQDKMVRHFMARRDLAQVEALLRAQVAKDTRNIEARRSLIRILRMGGDEDGALAVIRGGLAAVPKNPALLGDRVALNQARHRPELAIEDLRLLTHLQPGEKGWTKDLGRSLLQSGRVKEGVTVYEAFLNKNPSDKERWWNIIYAHSDRKLHAEAAEWLERFRLRFPEDPQGLDMLLYEYEVLERGDRVIDTLKRHLARHSDDLARGRTLANTLTQDGSFAEAAVAYEQLLARDPENRELWLNLAYVHEAAQDYPKAAVVLERYLAKYPDDGKARDRLASAYLSQKDRKKAIHMLEAYFAHDH